MELIKALIALVTSFFQNSTAKKKEEVKLADVTEKAVVENIRATANAEAVQQTQKTQEALEELHVKQKEERIEQTKKSLDDQLDNAFGSDE